MAVVTADGSGDNTNGQFGFHTKIILQMFIELIFVILEDIRIRNFNDWDETHRTWLVLSLDIL